MVTKNRTYEEMAEDYHQNEMHTRYGRACNSVFIGCWGVVILGGILAYVGLWYFSVDLFVGLWPFVWGTLFVTAVWIITQIYLKR